MPFISFACLIALAKTPSTMLNRSGEGRYPCDDPNLKGKAFIKNIVRFGFFTDAFYQVDKVPI